MNPLRALLLWMSHSPSWQRRISSWPATRRVVARFMPGEKLDEAVAAARQLNAAGMSASLNPLGEHVGDEATAAAAADEYVGILERIESEGLDANISVKLSQLGLDLSHELTVGNLSRILEDALRRDNFVRIDMESSAYVEPTLRIYEQLHDRFANLGVVIQAYLRRTADDIERLIPLAAPIRLVKGAYMEPAEIAFPKKADVDRNYARQLERLLDGGARSHGVKVAVATHDTNLIDRAKELIGQRQIDSGVEFQMLYGIRRDVQRQLVAEGLPLRIYVSYGVSWYAWFMRRLAERPANLTFFLRNLLR
ncbi:MAG: proline dehydrogenase family protein [Acidobacteriota bacterium]